MSIDRCCPTEKCLLFLIVEIYTKKFGNFGFTFEGRPLSFVPDAFSIPDPTMGAFYEHDVKFSKRDICHSLGCRFPEFIVLLVTPTASQVTPVLVPHLIKNFVVAPCFVAVSPFLGFLLQVIYFFLAH